jgi:hypothetical protein
MKNYEGNPATGHIIIRGKVADLPPRLVDALIMVSYNSSYESVPAGNKSREERCCWKVTEAMYLPATNLLHSYGYTPAIRPGG